MIEVDWPTLLDIVEFEQKGCALFDSFFTQSEVDRLKAIAERDVISVARRGGVRNLLDVPEMRELADDPDVRNLVESILGPGAKPVRGILFDKTSDANWKVPWHQDVTIAVAERVDTEGYGPWSTRAGVTHVQPPASVLERMVSLRIHLDDCPEENGALKVIPGSHRQGKSAEAHIARIVDQGSVWVCECNSGGLLVMRPLLVHSSAAAIKPGHRRIIHFDFAAADVATSMRWAVDASAARGKTKATTELLSAPE